MKKVGILTTHEGANYGAFLQALALQEAIKELGYDVNIINYTSIRQLLKELRYSIITKKICTIPARIAKVNQFYKTQKHYFHCTPFTHNPQKINDYNFDVIVLGSDEIWNYNNKVIKHDLTYFGKGINAGLISYAPSIGAIKPTDNHPKYISCLLSRFSHLSARDKNTALIVRQLTGQLPTLVLDPTLIYDLTKHHTTINENSKYLLVYAPTIKNSHAACITQYAKEQNLKIISVGYHYDWVDKNIIKIDPMKWMSYIANATFVFTTSFHGTLFSINYNKPFCTQAITSKIISTLKDVGLEKRMITATRTAKDILNDTGIDFHDVQKRLKKRRKESLEYLKNAIG
jgi:hypothetical protein